MPERLAVIGASGFVGSALTEYALGHTDLEVAPFCHSTGGATRLAHRKLEIRQLDLLQRDHVETAIHGFDYVVNCSRGGKRLMLDGLGNLLAACRKSNVKKFVHLSSVAVYGDPPPPTSTREDAPTEPARGGYGAVKLSQDEQVQRAAARGLKAVILCPPNIVGPYSDYLTDIIHSIETGRFRLIDDGNRPINVVDVNNLSACILAALTSDIQDGRRLFACEPGDITWQQLCDELAPLVRGDHAIPHMGAAAFAGAHAATDGQRASKRGMGRALTHLMSDEVRSAMRLNPTWASLESAAKSGVRSLGTGVEERLRDKFSGPIQVRPARPDEPLDGALIAQQLRGVRHDPARCQSQLHYQPPLSFAESMQSFRDWYVVHFEPDSPEWRLLGEAAA